MQTETIIFTECVNCPDIAAVMLNSFITHHPELKIHVFGSRNDLNALHAFMTHNGSDSISTMRYQNIIEEEITGIDHLFAQGHAGTAFVFATACTRWKGSKLIHIDSDIYFKKESVSLIESAFSEDYHIIGSRRCYKNNIINHEVTPESADAVSTYLMGIDTAKLPTYEFETLCRMCQGAFHPWGHIILDFFDPVSHAVIFNGGRACYLDSELVGGQNEHGKKTNSYTCNLHMDCGSHLAHFGGVGSGYAVFHGKSSPVKSYADWAVDRYALFTKLFYDKIILPEVKPPVYADDNRWVAGGWDDELLAIIKRDVFES